MIVKKYFKKFLDLSDSEKTKLIVKILIINNIICLTLGEMPLPLVYIVLINTLLVTPILVPIVLVLPFLIKKGKIFFFIFIL